MSSCMRQERRGREGRRTTRGWASEGCPKWGGASQLGEVHGGEEHACAERDVVGRGPTPCWNDHLNRMHPHWSWWREIVGKASWMRGPGYGCDEEANCDEEGREEHVCERDNQPTAR